MSKGKKHQPEVSKEQLREAEQGLIRLLFAKRFSREWIEQHVPEAMAQAQTDLAARIAAGREDETVGLLVVIAYRRALKALREEKRKPRTVTFDEVFDIADKYQRTPEQIVIDTDRQARLLRAIQYLPEKEKELLGLVYYGELDVKEAGRRLGWSSSSADRHHRAALAKLKALVGERSLLGADVAAPALIASNYSLPGRGLHHWLEAAGDRLRETLSWAVQRSAPLAEAGSAVGMSGAGRTTAGVCGLAVAACMAAVTSGALGPGVSVLHSAGSAEPRHQAAHHLVQPAAAPRQAELLEGAPPAAQPPSAYISERPGAHKARVSDPKRKYLRGAARATPASSERSTASQEAARQATEEFGAEAGTGEPQSHPKEGSSPPSSSPAPGKAAPAPAGKAESHAEFGM
jgi:DNA-directed RNA polymerase specialized sigma24 family protein